MNIALLDDDSLVTQLLSAYLNSVDEINVLFTAESGSDFFEILQEQSPLPDVVLIDLKMKGMDGIEVLKILRKKHPSVKAAVISSFYKKSFMGFILKTGASAFLPKGIAPEELISIVQEIYKKGYYFMPDQLDTVREQLSSKAPKPVLDDQNLLSEREIEILQLICQQKTAEEIGEILFIARRTVEGHKNNMFAKTGAKNLAGLVIYAIQNSIIDEHEVMIL